LVKPVLITHFGLATEIQGLQNQGYSVFCISDGLPAECTTKAGRSRGQPQYWWKESDLVAGKSNAITGATDPWKAVGNGMRLDGRAGIMIATEEMTEEQMIQMAMMASLVPEATPEPAGKLIDVPPEPAPDATGVAKIQFRMHNGNRVVRRFLNCESIAVVFAFVAAHSSPGQTFELKYGFPPKDLAIFKDKTIGEANLNGESIQARQL
jgi:hypothetical protein